MRSQSAFQNDACTYDDLIYSIGINEVKVTFDTCQPSVQLPVSAFSDGSGVSSDNNMWKAAQFHIHQGSEHPLDGKSLDAELHVVHVLDTALDGFISGAINLLDPGTFPPDLPGMPFGNFLAVVGVKLEAKEGNDANPVFQELLKYWADVSNPRSGCFNKDEVSGTTSIDGASGFNVYDLVPWNSCFFHYDGGLTTPPCTEAVWWNLAVTPVQISTDQARILKNIISCEDGTVADPTTGSTSRPPVFKDTYLFNINGEPLLDSDGNEQNVERELMKICPVPTDPPEDPEEPPEDPEEPPEEDSNWLLDLIEWIFSFFGILD